MTESEASGPSNRAPDTGRDGSGETERARERAQEDRAFTPVIIKRVDETVRHPDDVLENAIAEGVEQLERPFLSLALSSIAAGLILSFTVMAVAVVTQAMQPFEAPLLTRLATAFVYPLGFVICIMSGTQLFTEHTATAFYPVLDRRTPLRRLIRLWGVVIGGNLVGALASAVLLKLADPVVHARAGYVEIGHHLVRFGDGTLLVSAIMAGWLMALGAWLVLATPAAFSQMAAIYLVTFLIGIGGLHHSIAGAVESFTAVLVDEAFGVGQAARFLGVALVGNLIGGSLFVALLNYGHIRQTQTA